MTVEARNALVGHTPWSARIPLTPRPAAGRGRPSRGYPLILQVRASAPLVIRGAVLLALAAGAACRQDMQIQPKYTPLEPSSFFDDGRSARPIPEGAVARGHLEENVAFYTGKGPNGKPVDTLPFPVTLAVLERGQQRYDIYCSPCHDRTGSGQGMVVRRGFRRPPSLHTDRLRQAPNGYIFDVITNGFGAMPDYAAQVTAADRWAIVAYERALQLSQNASLNDVPPEARAQLGSQGGAR